MTDYNVHLKWQRETTDFDYKTYDRKHTVFFYGGPKIEVSSAPDFYRNPQFHSPEELFIAAVSSCYMLTFLAIAAKKRIIVDSYIDNATCTLNKMEGSNKQGITDIILHPQITFHQGNKPDEDTLQKIVHMAHDLCFIANSIAATLSIRPECTESLE